MPRSAHNHFPTPSSTTDNVCCGLPAQTHQFPGDHISKYPVYISYMPRRSQEGSDMPPTVHNHFPTANSTTDPEFVACQISAMHFLVTTYLTYPSCVLKSATCLEEVSREVICLVQPISISPPRAPPQIMNAVVCQLRPINFLATIYLTYPSSVLTSATCREEVWREVMCLLQSIIISPPRAAPQILSLWLAK